MARNFTFTKDQVIEYALDLIKNSGYEKLTARNLAVLMGTSSKPIFNLFGSMEGLKNEVIHSAKAIYNDYLSKEMLSKKYPIYKACGIGYLKFAMEQKELFKLIFMRDRSKMESLIEEKDMDPIIRIIMDVAKIDYESAKNFNLQMWLFVHGIATTIVTSFVEWDIEFLEDLLTKQFLCLKKYYCEG